MSDPSSKVWDNVTYPFLNYKGATIEVLEWIRNFIWHFIMDVAYLGSIYSLTKIAFDIWMGMCYFACMGM